MRRERIDLGDVTRLLEEAARTLVLPRFARLAAHDIEAKSTPGDPDDVVTIADHEVEEYLSRELTALAPEAAVVGEEGVHRHPGLLDLVGTEQPLWVIDPIDGTKNFAAGHDGFGIMVAWVVAGHARAAWLVLPARRQTFVAERGGGTFFNGRRIQLPAGLPRELLRGMVHGRYLPDGLSRQVERSLAGRIREMPSSGCAAVEYAGVLQGERDFMLYYRLLPWDHAAPALLLAEAGGQVVHASGERYTVRSPSQLTIVARNQAVADEVRSWLASGTSSPGAGSAGR